IEKFRMFWRSIAGSAPGAESGNCTAAAARVRTPRRAQRRVTNGEDGVRSHRQADARRRVGKWLATRPRGGLSPVERQPALGVGRAGVVGPRADQAVVGELFEDVRR